MPQLKQLSCTVQWADTGAPFPEYGTVYGDGVVESFIVVPNKPQPFTLHLKSLSYIFEGLAMVVFIDGNYQANRNRINLRPPKKDMPLNHSQIDFLVRQREKPLGEGIYMGRQWRFDNHNIVDSLPDGIKESHFDLLGTIEVLVLRCSARVPEEMDASGSSSAADSDVLCERGDRIVLGGDDQATTPSDKDGPHGIGLGDMVGSLALGGDATDERSDQQGVNGAGRPRGYTGRQQPTPSEARHIRTHSQHFRTGVPPGQHYLPQSHHTQSSHILGSQPPLVRKQVRFDVNPQYLPRHHHYPAHRPPSHERLRPSVQIPHQQGHHVPDPMHTQYSGISPVYGTPETQNNQYPNWHGPPYQQQPLFLSSDHYTMPQFGPPSYTLPIPQYSHLMQNRLHPHHSYPVPIYEPPHMLFNPYATGQPIWWPSQTGQNVAAQSSPSSTIPGDASQNPGHGENIGQQTTTNDDWLSGGDKNENNGTDGGTGEQVNNNSEWVDNHDGKDAGSLWVDYPTNEVVDGANDTQNNNSNTRWEDEVQPSNNATSNSSTTNKGSNGDDSGGNNDWSNEVADINSGSNPENNTSAAARALFGPHGQYYTYNPRGPDEPAPDAEEEPRYDVPRSIASTTGSTKQVLPGSGYMYWKRRRAPEYMDTMDEPYARFVFKYRTKEQLEKEIGINIEVEPTGDEAIQELQGMNKQELIEMLMRAKSALGGKVPSPTQQPANVANSQSVPVPVEPKLHPFLKYKLPELRKSVSNVASTSESAHGTTGGHSARSSTKGGEGNDTSAWGQVNNDTAQAQSDNWDNSNGGTKATGNSGWDERPRHNDAQIDWNGGTWDGTEEHNSTHDGANAKRSQGSHEYEQPNTRTNTISEQTQPLAYPTANQPMGQSSYSSAGQLPVGSAKDDFNTNWAQRPKIGSAASSRSTLSPPTEPFEPSAPFIPRAPFSPQ